MSKHTPGPWKVSIFGDIETEKTDEYGIAIRRIAYDEGCLGGGNEEDQANARLIAAAPELLEACKAVVKWAEVFGPITSENIEPFIQQCGAAIAKAEGELA